MRIFPLVGGAAIVASIAAADLSLAQAKRGAAPAARAQAATVPTATYWMSADTATGMSAMAAGMMPGLAGQAARDAAPEAAPRRPSAGAVIGGLLGGRTGGLFGWRGGRQQEQPAAQAPQAPAPEPVVRKLTLQLGSRTRPTGAPSAEHLVLAVLGVGPTVPLLTPETSPPARMEVRFERPRGRVLLYWGCGERARAGQPVTIDFSRLAAGQMPSGLATGPQIRSEQPPSAARFPGYGEWPNRRLSRQLPGNASLVGDHVVRGNYSPEIRFALAQGQDFLGPLRLTANSPAPSGAVPLRWQAVPNATAYLAMVMGSGRDETMVMWTSSETQLFGMGFHDYLNAADAARLVQSRVLMGPATTQCTVPAEVQRAIQGAMLMMTAYGPEANLAQPRPTGAPASWRPDWTVKLRTRSSHAGMLGIDMGAMMRGN